MTENKETKEVIMGITGKDYYRDARKLELLHRLVVSGDIKPPKLVYSHLGKNHIEYAFTSVDNIPFVSSIVDLAESLSLTHGMNYVDTVFVKMNHYFYVANDLEGNFSMVAKYSEDTFISSETIREVVTSGYNIEFDGILVVITLAESKGIKEDLESFKALADKFPNGFHK